MGVKSTRTLTRAAAEEKYVQLMVEDEAFLRRLRATAVGMTNTELEKTLERMNDRDFVARYGGDSGFDNYLIQD